MLTTISPALAGLAIAALTPGLTTAPVPPAPPAAPPAAVSAASDNVDDYVRSLTYNPDTVLTYAGEKVANPTATESELKDGTFRVITKKRKTISSNDADIAVLASTANTTFPGAILLAGQSLVENRPVVVSTARKPVTISVDLPGMVRPANQERVDNPTRANVNGAVNTLLERWNKDYAPSYPNPTASMQYVQTMAFSRTQLMAKFGYGFKDPLQQLNVDFDAIGEGKKQSSVIAFKQIFYTVSVNDPTAPSDMVGPGVTGADLKARGVDATNPPAYVSSVGYGRQMYVKLETRSTSSKVEATFKAIASGNDVSGDAEMDRIVKNSTFTAVVFGGSAKEQVKVISGKVSDLKDVIAKDATYSRTNPGAPITYTAKFLKDNAPAVVHSSSEYIETRVHTYNRGRLVLVHNGGYVAQFKVTWDEISYGPDGKERHTARSWDGNWQDRTAPFRTVIALPANARNVSVYAREATGLAWDWWRTVIDDQHLPMVRERVVTIGGTTLEPTSSNVVTPQK